MIKINRLRLLRNEKQKSLKDIANYLNVSFVTISNYETGRRDIPTETLIKLSKYYNVSIDYLLGNSNDRNKPSNIKKNW